MLALAAVVIALLWLFTLVLVILLARHNVKMGRGDRRGARRVAVFVLALGLLTNMAARHWVSDVEWVWAVISTRLGWPLYRVAFVWLAYLALEPFARRAWPHMLIGWSRLIDGRWKDPLVGQALLAGVVFGGATSAVATLPEAAGRLLGLAGAEPYFVEGALAPAAAYLSNVAVSLVNGVLFTLAAVAVMVIVRFALRAERAVFAVTALAAVVFSTSGVRPLALDLAQAAIVGTSAILFLRRFGLLALVAGVAVNYLVRLSPWTFDLTKWFAWRPMLSVILIMGLALWGFRNVLGHQAAFPKLQLD